MYQRDRKLNFKHFITNKTGFGTDNKQNYCKNRIENRIPRTLQYIIKYKNLLSDIIRHIPKCFVYKNTLEIEMQ